MKFATILTAAFGALCSASAMAQDFPSHPIRIGVPYAAGGLPDTMTRFVSPHMARILGPQAYGAIIKASYDRYAKVVKSSGTKVD